jgi:hypothetical protein
MHTARYVPRRCRLLTRATRLAAAQQLTALRVVDILEGGQ